MFSGKDFTPAKIQEVQENSPALISGLKKEDIILSINNNKVNKINDHLEEFENLLKDKLNEIFDIKLPFIETDDKENCKFCSYKKLCAK